MKQTFYWLIQFSVMLIIVLICAVFILGSVVLTRNEFFILFLSLMSILLLMLVWAYIIDRQYEKKN